MRVALVVTGGVDRSGRDRVIPVLLSLIERLARQHEVVVYALRYHEAPCSYPLLGAMVHDLGRPRGIARQYTALVAALRRQPAFDVIHGYWSMPAGLVAAAAARRLGVPSIVTADSGEFVGLPDIRYGLQLAWRHRLAVAASLRLATRVTVCTRFMERLAAGHGCAPEIIPLGVDVSVFQPAGRIQTAADDSPSPKARRLLHVARLNPVKDQATLLRALRRVADAVGPSAVHLDIVGEDTMNGGVQRIASELGLRDTVTFHGPLPTQALVPLYQRADLVAISSRHEAACVVALEAAASGVAVVGTAVGYLHDWSPDRAVSVPVGDAEALGRVMLDLLHDSGRRRAIELAARAWAAAHDADWTAARFTELYREVSGSAG